MKFNRFVPMAVIILVVGLAASARPQDEKKEVKERSLDAPNGLTKDQMNAQPGRMKELTDVINGLTKDTTNAHHGVAVATGTPSGTVLSNGFVTHTIGWQTGISPAQAQPYYSATTSKTWWTAPAAHCQE